MANIAKTYTLVNGQPADATQVNKNFDDIIAGVGDTATLRPTLSSLGALPLSGGTLTGTLYGAAGTDYTTGRVRNIFLSTGDASGGGNGDIWIKYSA